MFPEQANYYLAINDLCRTKIPFNTIEEVMKAFKKYVCDKHDIGRLRLSLTRWVSPSLGKA